MYGKIKYPKLISAGYVPIPNLVKIIKPNHGIKVNRKFIPTNRHLANGKMYFGIYTLLIKEKLSTTEVMAVLLASEKYCYMIIPVIKYTK